MTHLFQFRGVKRKFPVFMWPERSSITTRFIELSAHAHSVFDAIDRAIISRYRRNQKIKHAGSRTMLVWCSCTNGNPVHILKIIMSVFPRLLFYLLKQCTIGTIQEARHKTVELSVELSVEIPLKFPWFGLCGNSTVSSTVLCRASWIVPYHFIACHEEQVIFDNFVA